MGLNELEHSYDATRLNSISQLSRVGSGAMNKDLEH